MNPLANNCLNFVRPRHVIGAGEGRRPWATTFSPSLPNIRFFLFPQPRATTISPSVPPHLTLPGKTTFLNGIVMPLKFDFKKSSRVTQKSTTQTIFSFLLKINILCFEFLNCSKMKFLTNLTEYCILKYHKSLMIIKILTHYTKSILKSLINQLCDISRCNTQSNLSKITL